MTSPSSVNLATPILRANSMFEPNPKYAVVTAEELAWVERRQEKAHAELQARIDRLEEMVARGRVEFPRPMSCEE